MAADTTRPYGCRDTALPAERPLAPDLTRATAFAYASAERLRATGAGELAGEFYPRYGHPAGRLFERAVARAEDADGSVAFSSGMAALFAVFATFAGAGTRIAVSRHVYGGVEEVVTRDLPRLGVEVRRFDPFDAADTAHALDGPLALAHVETPTNPLCRIVDLTEVVRRAHACGALVSVDATFLPPPLQRPLGQGADLSVHSATKILGGHSDVLGGVVSGPHALLERLEAFRRRTGAVLAPDSAWLLLRSMDTLELRARRACATALHLARVLDALREQGAPVAAVYYPGLTHHPDHAVAGRCMDAFGFVLAFEIAGGIAAAVRVYERLRVIARAVSLGGVHTVASLPVHTSHAATPAAERRAAGIGDGLIRLSVGTEPVDVLEADLCAALAAA